MLAPLPSHASPDAERHHLGLRDHRHGFEVERGERLAGGQTRLGEMPLDAAAATVGHLVLGEGRKEAGRRPAFLVGLLGELGPHQLDARQAQLAEQQFDAGGVDRCWLSCVMPRPPGWRLRCDSSRPADAPARRSVLSGTRLDLDHRHRRRALARTAARSTARSGNRPASSSASISLRQLGLAGRGRAPAPAARPSPCTPACRQRSAHNASKARRVGRTREQLVAVDQIVQRHRLFAQRVDDVPIIDDVAALALGRPAARAAASSSASSRGSSRAGRRRGARAGDGRSAATAPCRTRGAG